MESNPTDGRFSQYRVMEDLGLATTAELMQFAIKARILVP